MIGPKYSVTFEQPTQLPSQGWVSYLLNLPGVLYRKIRNTCLLAWYQEFREPLRRNICPMRPWHSFETLAFHTMKVTSNPSVMQALLKGPRSDPQGLFLDRENGPVFLPLFQDMYPDATVTKEDSLFTCTAPNAAKFRKPILEFIGSKSISNHADTVEQVVQEAVRSLSTTPVVDAHRFSTTFTTNMISKLLLGHPGPADTYADIASALDFLGVYGMKRAFRVPPSQDDKERYPKATQTMKEAIETALNPPSTPALGSLADNLKKADMSDLQIRTTLFFMYSAGSETSASLLNYTLWQLGKHPDWQDKIRQGLNGSGSLYDRATKSVALGKVFAEGIRLNPSAYVIARQPARDLTCTIQQNKILHHQSIAQKEQILASPAFAARDPALYPNPDTFNPDRFIQTPTTFAWLPFGSGTQACPGQFLATVEIKCLIAELVQHYKLASTPDTLHQKGYLILKPQETVWLTLTPRD